MRVFETTTVAVLWAITRALTVPVEPVTDEYVFAVAPGKTTKTYEVHTSRTTEESALSLGEMGEHNPGEGMQSETTETFRVEDECLATDGGRPTRLRRHYAGLETEVDMDAPEQHGTEVRHDEGGASELEGLTVLFELDVAKDEFARRYEDEEDAGEQEWLTGLRADMDFLRFLPDEAVSVGDSWSIEVAAIADLLDPGGELMVRSSGPSDRDLPQGGIQISLGDPTQLPVWDGLEGEIEVRFERVRSDGDERIAVLAFAVDVEGTHDVADALTDESEKSGIPVLYDAADLERVIKGKGRLSWNLDAGRLHGLDFEAEMEAQVDMEWSADTGAMELDLTLHQVLTGTYEVEVTVE